MFICFCYFLVAFSFFVGRGDYTPFYYVACLTVHAWPGMPKSPYKQMFLYVHFLWSFLFSSFVCVRGWDFWPGMPGQACHKSRKSQKYVQKHGVVRFSGPKLTKMRNEDWILDVTGCPSQIKESPGPENVKIYQTSWFGVGAGVL